MCRSVGNTKFLTKPRKNKKKKQQNPLITDLTLGGDLLDKLMKGIQSKIHHAVPQFIKKK